MTTIFIWNNCQVSAGWSKFAKKCKLPVPEKWSHAVSGHASLMISEEWEKPIKDIASTKGILEEYGKLRTALEKLNESTPEHAGAMGKLEKQGERFEECLTDRSDLYVSFFPDAYAKSSHATNPVKKMILDKFGKNFGVNYFRRGLIHRSFWHDLLWENYVPDHIIRIPETAAQKQLMKKAWEDQRGKNDGDISYRFKYKNCSRLAARVLIAGFGNQLNLYWTGKVKARKIWTPLHVKRLAFKISQKVKGATALSWDEFVDEVVTKGTLPRNSGDKLKKYKRRSSVRGSSGADARFNYQKGKLSSKEDQNTAAFLEPLLGTINADNAGHIFGLGDTVNHALFHAAADMGLLQPDNGVSNAELDGTDIFSDDFDPTAGMFQFSTDA